jgi:glycosyltransferase involved in cell wall biosynthesis
MKSTISVCLMVRNEEKNLPRCLGSIEKLGIMDELIVLDTGSTDRTIEIAQSFGAKVIIPDDVSEYFVKTKFGPKINFSKARNASFEHATGDWLFLVDADEEIVGDASGLQDFIKGLPADAEGIAILFEDRQKGATHVRFPPPRFFKNGCIRYEGIVHNMPHFKEPAYIFNDLKVLHYGFDLTGKAKKEKSERTLGLLEADLKNNPKDYRIYFYLAQHYGEAGEYEKCIEHCIKYLRNRPYLERFNPSIYYTLVQACLLQGEPVLADKWLAEAMRELPDDIDIATAIMDFGVWQNKANVVLQGASMFIRAYDKVKNNPGAMGSRFVYNFRPDALVKALFHVSTMRLQEGVSFLTRLKNEMQNESITKKTRDLINKDMKKALADFGVEWTDQYDKPKTTKRKATTKKG